MSPNNRCQTCGGFVSDQYVRVFSANDKDAVWACENDGCPGQRDSGDVRVRRDGTADLSQEVSR